MRYAIKHKLAIYLAYAGDGGASARRSVACRMLFSCHLCSARNQELQQKLKRVGSDFGIIQADRYAIQFKDSHLESCFLLFDVACQRERYSVMQEKIQKDINKYIAAPIVPLKMHSWVPLPPFGLRMSTELNSRVL